MGTKNKGLAEAFGKRLRELREAAGLSQSGLGNRMTPKQLVQAVARYESGTRVPTLALLYQLAAALGCAPCDLLPAGMSPPAAPKKRRGKS